MKVSKNIKLVGNILMLIFLSIYYLLVLKEIYVNKLGFDIPIYTLTLFPFVIATIIILIFKKSKISFILSLFICFVVQWIIFLNVNPYPLNQNNKYEIVKLFPKQYRPSFQFSLENINNKSYSFPIIVKPKFCSGDGKNIHIIKTQKELNTLLKNIKNKSNYLVEQFLQDYPIEIGVMYEKGKVVEVVEKLNNNRKIRFYEYGFAKQYNNFLNNTKLNNIFNKISSSIQGLNVGRYDIRLKKIDDLLENKFKILEVNGTMGFYFTDSENKNLSNLNDILKKTMFDISLNLKWYFTRLYIGIINILTLKGYSPISLLYVMFHSFWNMIGCRDWENIYSLYS